jgi:hypothetical protein
MGLSLDVLCTGKKYRLINFGETHEFVIEYILGNGDFKVKDLIINVQMIRCANVQIETFCTSAHLPI